MKFLIIAQDLRVFGTSEGMVSRSFIAKLRNAYPQAEVDLVYLKHQSSNDQLDLLPVDSLETHILDLKIPLITRWCNKIYWRLFHLSLNELHIQKQYKSYLQKIDYQKYAHIFIRSSGLQYDCILGAKDLPILKKAIVNFHDPYPVFWCAGNEKELVNLELFRWKEMYKVVCQAKSCMSPSEILSTDMQFLYGSKKQFHTLPHQYCESVFKLIDTSAIRKKQAKVSLSYHGILQFGRNLDIVLEAYQELLDSNPVYKASTEFVLRLKGNQTLRLKDKFFNNKNIVFLEQINLASSSAEQATESDIIVILENGPKRSNILVGKAPFVASLNKPVLCLSPVESELRQIIKENRFIAKCDDKKEIKEKLEKLIQDSLKNESLAYPFGDYFSDENFKLMLDKVLFGS